MDDIEKRIAKIKEAINRPPSKHVTNWADGRAMLRDQLRRLQRVHNARQRWSEIHKLRKEDFKLEVLVNGQWMEQRL